jgi:hypothetical protein
LIGDNGKEAVLAVFNDSRTETVSESIELPGSYRNAQPVYEEQQVHVADGLLHCTVAPEDACIVHLR